MDTKEEMKPLTTGKKIGLEWSRLCMFVVFVLTVLVIIEYVRTGKIHPMTTTVLGSAMAGLGITWTAKATSNFAPDKKPPIFVREFVREDDNTTNPMQTMTVSRG